MESAYSTSNRGFTLIEMMIVIVIIAVLAAIALPAYSGYITKSKMKAAQSDLVSLGLALENRFQRQLSYPTSTTSTTEATANAAGKTWQASTDSDFDFKISAVDSTSYSYTITATGKSGSLSNCVISLTRKNDRSTSGCPYGDDKWL